MKSDDEIVLEEIEAMSKVRFLPIVGRKKGALLEKLVKKHKPKNCLEVGTLLGYSAILIARNLSSDATLTTIEINPAFARAAEKNIARAGFADKVTVKMGDAVALIPRLRGKFDLVFLDAAKEEYIVYLKKLEKNLPKGAVVVADNVKMFADYIKDYTDYVRKSGNFRSKIHDFGSDAMEVSLKL